MQYRGQFTFIESIIAHDLQASTDTDEPCGGDVKYERWPLE